MSDYYFAEGQDYLAKVEEETSLGVTAEVNIYYILQKCRNNM